MALSEGLERARCRELVQSPPSPVAATASALDKRDRPAGTPRTVDQLERQHHQDGADGGQLCQVRELRQSVLACPQHEVVAWERGLERVGRSSIRAYRLHADADYR